MTDADFLCRIAEAGYQIADPTQPNYAGRDRVASVLGIHRDQARTFLRRHKGVSSGSGQTGEVDAAAVAKVVELPRREGYESALVINDLHIPFENPRAVDLMLQVGLRLDPDYLFLNGDIVDCWEISRFDKNPALEGRANLRVEIDRAREFLTRLRALFPRPRIIYIFGNHDYRWSRFIASNARALNGLEGMSLGEQLHAEQNRIEIIDRGLKENSYQWGKLLIGHFDRVHKHSGYSAKNLLDDKSISLIQGHTHRGGSSYKRLYDRDVVAYENYCLCDRTPCYADRPNWQLGFSIVFKDRASDFFYVEPHPITEVGTGESAVYKVFYNGQCYAN